MGLDAVFLEHQRGIKGADLVGIGGGG